MVSKEYVEKLVDTMGEDETSNTTGNKSKDKVVCIIHFTDGSNIRVSEANYKTIVNAISKGTTNYQTFWTGMDCDFGINLSNVTYFERL